MTPVNLPNLTNGYQRKSQAILFGNNAIGAAPAAPLGDPIFTASGEITAAAPVVPDPVHGHRGPERARVGRREAVR